jgi:hypothetical protein
VGRFGEGVGRRNVGSIVGNTDGISDRGDSVGGTVEVAGFALGYSVEGIGEGAVAVLGYSVEGTREGALTVVG